MSIVLGKTYLDILDKVYKEKSLSAILDSNPALIKQAANGQDFLIPSLTMAGPAPYSRTAGLVAGAITTAWQTVTPGYDRGRKFVIDSQDAAEGVILDMTNASAVYVETGEVPEVDAYRFSLYASTTSVLEVASPATLASGDAVLAAIAVAQTAMDDAEVNRENRILFITPGLLRLAKNIASTAINGMVLDEFAAIVPVPQSRFYKGITLLDGTTGGQEAGGYTKTSSTGRDINFLIIQKDAIIQAQKHRVAEVIEPKYNNDGDGYILKLRHYGVADVTDKKLNGVYSHIKAS